MTPATNPVQPGNAASLSALAPNVITVGATSPGLRVGGLLDRLNAARNRAHGDGLPTRRKDGALYALLAECLGICEEAIRDDLMDYLRDITRISINERQPRGTVSRAEGNSGRGRRYIEASSDAYTIVVRFVMWDRETRANLSRYSGALREAARRQIGSSDLEGWLRENGGFVALYRARENRAALRQTRTLYLDAPVAFQIGVPLTLTLLPLGGGKFSVRDPKEHHG